MAKRALHVDLSARDTAAEGIEEKRYSFFRERGREMGFVGYGSRCAGYRRLRESVIVWMWLGSKVEAVPRKRT